MYTPRTKGFALLRFSCSPPFLLPPPPTSLCRGGSGNCEFSLPFSRRLGLENGCGGSLWYWEEQEMWLGLSRLSLVPGWAQGWWLAGEGVVIWKSIAGSIESVLEKFGKKNHGKRQCPNAENTSAFLFPVVLALGLEVPRWLLLFWFSISFCVKEFPHVYNLGKSLIFSI